MAEDIAINVFGDQQFRLKIMAMRGRAADMSPVLESIGDDWLDIVEETFASEGRRILGRPWAPLARETVVQRGSSHPILVDTAEMLVEMTDPANIRISGQEITMDLPGVMESSGVGVRAESHQYGYWNQQAEREVPARPMIGFTPLDRKVWNTRMTDYLVNGRL
jgi:hypothetical protein